MTSSDKQEDDDEKVSGKANVDDDNCDPTNTSSFFRQPCKQGSASGPIEMTAGESLPVSSCPTVIQLFKGSG